MSQTLTDESDASKSDQINPSTKENVFSTLFLHVVTPMCITGDIQ